LDKAVLKTYMYSQAKQILKIIQLVFYTKIKDPSPSNGNLRLK